MKLYCDITLPASKSESNRALMIAAYGGFAPEFQNLSDSNDTKVLNEALASIDSMPRTVPCWNDMHTKASFIDIADCGTAARFMATYLACHPGDWLLTGTEENEGCLPLRIKGNPVAGGKISVDMTQSSQFASSVVLAAPMFSQGLEMELLGELSSLPYLDMTIAMQRHFFAQVERQGRTVVVKPRPYQPRPFSVEPDWSAASYWYEMAALSEDCEIRLHGLGGPSTGSLPASLQGDAIIAEWMRLLGVGTFVEGNDIVLRKIPFEKRPLHFDFSFNPDLYSTMVATCAGLNVEATFTGLDNLALKESDRVRAMQKELAKLGKPSLHFCAHNDHRIVMALAPLALLYGSVTFDYPEVVEKSYPNYWIDASFLPVNR